jgi:hypothetical protein
MVQLGSKRDAPKSGFIWNSFLTKGLGKNKPSFFSSTPQGFTKMTSTEGHCAHKLFETSK